MKYVLIIFTLLINTACLFAQDLRFDIHPNYKHGITRDKLLLANSIADVIDGYPKNWLKDLISVDISFKNNDKLKYISSSEEFTPQQKSALKTADLGSEVQIHILYHKKNPVTEFLEVNIMDYSFKVIPDKLAFYEGGIKALREHLNAQIKGKFTTIDIKKIEVGIVDFTVNEAGEIVDVVLDNSTKDISLDAFIMDVIKKQGKWSPAMTKEGKPVKQSFRVVLSSGDC